MEWIIYLYLSSSELRTSKSTASLLFLLPGCCSAFLQALPWMPYTLVSHIHSTVLAPYLLTPKLFSVVQSLFPYVSSGLHLVLMFSTDASRLTLVKLSTVLKDYHSSSPSPSATHYIQFLVLPWLCSIPTLPWHTERAWAGNQQQRSKQKAATLRIAWKHLGGIAEKDTDMFSEVKFWVQLASWFHTSRPADLHHDRDPLKHNHSSGEIESGQSGTRNRHSTQTNREGDMTTVINI